MTPLVQQVVRHSPTGFEWGYGGSGPSDLALNIALLYVPRPTAERIYQDLKWRFIAPARADGERISLDAVRAWVEQRVEGLVPAGGEDG